MINVEFWISSEKLSILQRDYVQSSVHQYDKLAKIVITH
jgi:hypothetical protein